MTNQARASRIQPAKEQLVKLCSVSGIPVQTLAESKGLFAAFIDKEHKGKSQSIIRESRSTAFEYLTTLTAMPIDSGVVVILSEDAVQTWQVEQLLNRARTKFTPFSKQLNSVLSGSLPNQPKKVQVQETKKPRKRFIPILTLESKISEALDGIATADGVQPTDSLKNLYHAMQTMGLDQQLKQGGISWHIPPDKHSITFNKGGTPILQLDASQLNADKELSEVLLQLQSLAQGQAPQATAVASNHVKDLAAKIRDTEKQVQDVASQFIPQPAVQTVQPGAAPAATAPAQPAKPQQAKPQAGA